MNPKNVSVCIDLLFCVVMLPLILTLMPVEVFIMNRPEFFITLTVFLYLLYFCYRKMKIPHLVVKKKYWIVVLFLAICFTLTYLLSHFPFSEDDLAHPGTPISVRQQRQVQLVWFLFLVVTGFSLSIELTIELFRQVLYRKEIEAEKNHAQLALYKAQINPHFLFNTLNSLYGLVLVQSEHLESAFVKFSNILKYTYYKSTSDFLPIDDEVEYIRQYIELQQLRLNRHTKVIFESDIENDNIPVPSMLLITFVENCFKYGVSAEIDCSIIIRLKEYEGILLFETENNIMSESDNENSRIGIENCRKRLDLLYPDRYSLDMSKRENTFMVRLKIILR